MNFTMLCLLFGPVYDRVVFIFDTADYQHTKNKKQSTKNWFFLIGSLAPCRWWEAFRREIQYQVYRTCQKLWICRHRTNSFPSGPRSSMNYSAHRFPTKKVKRNKTKWPKSWLHLSTPSPVNHPKAKQKHHNFKLHFYYPHICPDKQQ